MPIVKVGGSGLFRSANAETLKQLDEALVRLVARRLKHYQADHGLPYHRPPLPFEIRIDAVDLG